VLLDCLSDYRLDAGVKPCGARCAVFRQKARDVVVVCRRLPQQHPHASAFDTNLMCDGVDIGPAACRQRGQSRQQIAPTRRLCPLLVAVKLFVRLAVRGRPDHFVGRKADPRRVRGYDCAGFVAEQDGIRPEWLVDTPTLAGVLDLDAGDQAPLHVAAPRS
jgi:hypothetical protein